MKKFLFAATLPFLLLSSYNVAPNSTFSVFGYGFVPNERVVVVADGHSQVTNANSAGSVGPVSFAASFTPSTNPVHVYATGITYKIPAHAFVNVSGYYPVVTPNSYFVIPGGSVNFTGRSFAPNEQVRITSGGQIIDTITANSSGNINTGSYQVGYNLGRQQFVFTGLSSGSSFSVNISIAQPQTSSWIILSNYYAGAGTVVTITGHGFGMQEVVTLSYAGNNLGQTTTSSNGDFSFDFVVPALGAGQKLVAARSSLTGAVATQYFSQAF